jgi:multidrug efflux pump subunit AcrB
VVTAAVVVVGGLTLGREIFPAGGVSQFQLRFRAPAGTKFESTERLATDVLDDIKSAAGPTNVDITLGYVGVQPSSYPINTIFLWTGGSHEGVLQVALRPEAGIRLTDFEETLRRRFSERFPAAQFSFEPGDIVNRIMNFGTSTPVEVAVTGPDFGASRTFAARLRQELARIPALRDLQYGQALDYPAIQVDVNRQRAGQLGVTVDQIGRSFAASTSSSRFVAPNYWADPRSGIAFQVQIEVPQPRIASLDDLRVVPVSGERGAHALLGDVATIDNATIVGEYDRLNGQRMVTLTANVAGQDLGRTVGQVEVAQRKGGVDRLGEGGRYPGGVETVRQEHEPVEQVAIGASPRSHGGSHGS